MAKKGIINNVTKGHCIGVSGMKTDDMLTTQFTPLPRDQRQEAPKACRSLRAVLRR